MTAREELRDAFAKAIRECREAGGMSATEIADEVLEVHEQEAARRCVEVLREAAEALRVENRRILWATKPDTCPDAEFLDRMADAVQAGKDTREGESTQPAPRAHAPSVPGTCARARGTYDWVSGTTPKRDTPCRPYPELSCVATCRITEGGDA